MPFTQFTNLDFEDIKVQIKDFLRSNSNFQDFDFEGSNFSVLIDTLAYNTYINAFNANLVVNESFLDSATVRENVVSLARNIGYVPRSKTAATATIKIDDIDLGLEQNVNISTLTLRAGLICIGNAENTTFRFSIPDNITSNRIVNKTVDGEIRSFAQFDNEITIYEGTYLQRVYRVDTTVDQRYIIDSPNIDSSTLRVYVAGALDSGVGPKYSQVDNILNLNKTSEIYLTQEVQDEKYEILFGDGLFGKKLENGQTFVIRADKLSPNNKYIQSVSLNGQTYDKSYLLHSDIMRGGELIFLMGDEPSDWGSKGIPPSSITKNLLTSVPFFMAESQTFTDSLLVELGSAQEALIRYTLDSSQPSSESPIYDQPIVLYDDAIIKAKAFSSNGHSQEVSSTFYKIDGSRSITIQSKYANQYAAAGDKTLIDYLRGTGSYRTGSWQGYREDLEATIDLGSVKPINYLAIGFLQDIKSWIFYPPQVEFLVSEDGQNFKSVALISNTFSDQEYGSFHQDFSARVTQQARYIKVKAKNYGLCPDWHLGAGGTTWLFADEIIIK